MNGTAQMVIIRVLGNCYNWQTVQSIPTPVNTIVSKARFWRDLWVIQQKDEVFYTSSQKVEWKHFPVNGVDFFPDKEGGKSDRHHGREKGGERWEIAYDSGSAHLYPEKSLLL